jgi:hypothetical protein
MFDFHAFGEYGFCDAGYTPLDTSAFDAFLAEVTGRRCWVLELDAYSLAQPGGVSCAFGDAGFGEVGFGEARGQETAGVSTLRFSTHGYTSHADDSPAHTYHESRIKAPPIVDRQIAGRDGIGGLTTVYAEITLNNRDGGLDELDRDYSLGGRRARILIGRAPDPLTGKGGDALANFGVVFTGVLQVSRVGEDVMQIRLSDGTVRLQRRLVNEATYTGAGALEGGDDIKGRNKPVALGEALNVPAPLVDSAKLIYQVNDGEINDVPAAYDRGIALDQGADYTSEADLNTTAPAAGEYRVYKAGGYVRLGATPAGTMTFDVEGDASGGYVTTVAEIVHRIVAQRAGLNSSEIDPTSIAQLAIDAPAPVGLWIGTSPMSCAQVVDDLLYGIGAFGGFSRYGAFTVGRVADAIGETEAAAYSDIDIMDVQREALPAPVDPIVWRVGVGWQRNYTVQNDFAAAVPAARRTFAAQPLRISSTEDSGIFSRHLLARNFGPIEAHYAEEADADDERDRLFALWGVKRSLFRILLRNMSAMALDLGEVVRIEHYPRQGLAAGASARVLGHRIQGSRVELKVLV